MKDSEWQKRARCLGEDIEPFFAENTDYAIKTFCDKCPVAAECLEMALEIEAKIPRTHIYGIFGGVTAAERMRIRGRKRRESGMGIRF